MFLGPNGPVFAIFKNTKKQKWLQFGGIWHVHDEIKKKKRKKKFNISSFISTRRVAFLLFASLIWSQNWNFKFGVENFKQAMRITQLLRGTHVSQVVHVCSQIWSLLRILKAHLSDQIAHFSRGQTIGPWLMPMHIDVQLFLLLIILSNVVQRIEIPYRMREILLIKTKKKKVTPTRGDK